MWLVSFSGSLWQKSTENRYNWIATWSSHLTSGMFPKEFKARSWREICTPMFIVAFIIHISQEVEATQVSMDGWKDKQNVAISALHICWSCVWGFNQLVAHALCLKSEVDWILRCRTWGYGGSSLGLEHPWILVFMAGPGANPPQIWGKTVIHTMEYHSVFWKKEILPFVTTWMNLEGIMLSETGKTEKDKYGMIITYMWNIKKPNSKNK